MLGLRWDDINTKWHGLTIRDRTEWLEIPAGVVAQLMGHKPSATAEKHYTVRPLVRIGQLFDGRYGGATSVACGDLKILRQSIAVSSQ